MLNNTFYFHELVNAIRDYCLLIEHVEIYNNDKLLADMARILPRIHTAMAHLDEPNIEYSFFSLPDLEERFELYCRLKQQLGVEDDYYLKYDSQKLQEEMNGSLASDLTDIYFELKRGLILFDAEQDNHRHALKLWQISYMLHWGQHLVNAQKHLFVLHAAKRLPSWQL